MQTPPTTSALFADESFVIGKCEFFVDVQLWPFTSRMNPRRWLENFHEEEKPYALHLLNAFTYFSRAATEQLFIRAFQGLSRRIRTSNDSLLSAKHKWRAFLNNVIVTCVRGENPHPVDSGLTFLRMARQSLGLSEVQIMEPAQALQNLRMHPDRPVVFLDDFVGSGNQFLSTWNSQHGNAPESSISFAQISLLLRETQFFYCPLICTEYGRQKIQANCRKVQLEPAHIIGAEYSAVSQDSKIWPIATRPSAITVIRNASKRAGIADHSWQGFHNLGLALAFEDSVPDATLPLFHHKSDGWMPLIERT